MVFRMTSRLTILLTLYGLIKSICYDALYMCDTPNSPISTSRVPGLSSILRGSLMHVHMHGQQVGVVGVIGMVTFACMFRLGGAITGCLYTLCLFTPQRSHHTFHSAMNALWTLSGLPGPLDTL